MRCPRFGSLFAGIGGFDLGLERAGWECAWQVEIDLHAQAVERYRWPNVKRFPDVTKVGRSTLAPVDLLCGGFPCQDLSVAGRRAGLAGGRSGLFWEVCRIAGELRPRWLLLENVGGLLSSNGGRDFGAVLAALGQLGYWWTYRCLDSQHFGVPQRRYRVFVVGHLGGPCPPEVLLEPESLPGDLAARGEARERIAATLTQGAESGGRGGYANSGADSGNLIAHTLRADGFDAGEDGTGRGTPLTPVFFNATQDPIHGEIAGALSDQGAAVCTGFAFNQRREGRLQDVAGTVAEPSGTQVDGALTASGVRRLTPRECERLQGFPDDWTLRGVRENGAAYELKDGPRYRLLGNAVTVNVAEWIGHRVMSAHLAALTNAEVA